MDYNIDSNYKTSDSKILIIIFCCVAIVEFFSVTNYKLQLSFSTYVSIVFVLFGVGLTLKLAFDEEDNTIDCRNLVLMLLFWNFVTIVRGAINAESYWDWKVLIFSNMPALLIPSAALLGCKLFAITDLLLFIRKYYFITVLLLLFIVGLPSKIIYLWSPIYFFILAYKYLPLRKRYFIFILAFFLFFADMSARSNLIRLTVAVALCLSFWWISRHQHIISTIHKTLSVLPFLFLFLGLSGTFNVFDMNSYLDAKVEVKNDEGKKDNLLADTRTGLYKECLSSMEKKGSFIFGEGGCGKYHSILFQNKQIGKNRYASEVGALNILLYSGIVGLFLYWMVFVYASYKAINDSANILSKLIGLFIIFRWNYFFVEDFTTFNTNFFFLWLMIGMCLSPQFRYLTDEEICDLLE